MSPSPKAPTPPPPPPPRRPGAGRNGPSSPQGRSDVRMPRWGLVALGILLLAVLAWPLLSPQSDANEITFSELRQELEAGNVESLEYNNNNGHITGEYTDEERG